MKKYFLVTLQNVALIQGWKALGELITKGAQSTNECFTPEYLAGQYAYWEATGRDSVNNRTFKDELKLLKQVGAVFDADKALEEANKFKEALTDQRVSFVRLAVRREQTA